MTMAQPGTVTFETTVAGSGGKTGMVIPEDVIDRLGAGRRPAVHVEVNGYSYRSTVAVMGGSSLISISAAVREATGLDAGHPVSVTLSVATTAREVDMPQDLLDALADDEQARVFFGALPNSLQRYHADHVRAAKTQETRRRRVQKALALFREGKKR